MKIGFTTMGCDAGRSGIGRYTKTLLRHWSHQHQDLRVLGHDSERRAFAGDSNLEWHSVSERWKKPLASVLWHQVNLPRSIQDVDVMFLPAGNRRLPLFLNVPSVGTVHDCSSLHVQGKYDAAREFYIKQVLPRLMQRLDHIVTVSDSTRRDLVDYCGIAPDKVSVIPLAADPLVFFPRSPEVCQEDLRKRFGLSNPFLLYTSRIEHPGKNHVRLISAFEQLKRKTGITHDLVFVGPERERAEEVKAFAARNRFGGNIHFLGMVPDCDLPAFYTAADALIFPSLYEGFGLPLLEAMACGTRVACSNLSSLPEVAGDAALLFDPHDENNMVEVMSRLIFENQVDRQSRIMRSIARAAEFSWHRTADTTLALLREIARGGELPSTLTNAAPSAAGAPAKLVTRINIP